MVLREKDRHTFYAGKPQPSVDSPGSFKSINPSTAEPVCTIHTSSPSAIEAAIKSAQSAFHSWSATPPVERARILLRAVALLRQRNDELARVETLDTGKPFSETSAVDIVTGADVLEYFANLVAGGGLNGETFRLRPSAMVYTAKEPLGVCAGIGAWNYPIQIALWKSAPCLAAGNCMVYKPSEYTPMHAQYLAAIYHDAGLPEGAFNVVYGAGEVGGQLTANPAISKVSFTGQVSKGKKVAGAAGGGIKYVTMELGGKSPWIVLPDANVDQATDGALLANFFSTGQVCTNGTRVFVPRQLKHAFEKAVLSKMQHLRAGDIFDAATNFGPLSSKPHYDKVVSYVRRGIAQDKATLLYGGVAKPSGLPSGFKHTSDDFDFDSVRPLLQLVLTDSSDDSLIWSQVYKTLNKSFTPPPRPIASSLRQTPWRRNTSSFANSSEHRKHVDGVLKEELGPLYVGLRDLQTVFFGGVADLDTVSETTFTKCKDGEAPLFDERRQGWPEDADQEGVLHWFAGMSDKLAELAKEYRPDEQSQRRPLANRTNQLTGLWGSASRTLVSYAREVLAAQDTRRFVLDFTICGSFMRVWVFDRLGGIASERFDINEDGQQFVSTILCFLWMDEQQLGFDSSMKTSGGQRFIEIERDGLTERIIIHGAMQRARCIAGRATTCWKAHCEATAKGVVNVARYYHDETVQVRDMDDDIRRNVRKGLDITKAENYRQRRSAVVHTSGTVISREGRSITAGVKRSSSQTGSSLSSEQTVVLYLSDQDC
ncbi:betaine-aldehyde dehydrogenase [Apiospora kogelbergensis]|uniref:betaine-aldehyde dehydrogenase n=1 Tax=Apiospora kogelbergensis TaxID=1337665 RepID=UPI0031325C4C